MVTGWFEVYLEDKLIHSKKNGQGFVDSPGKFERICKLIQAELDKIPAATVDPYAPPNCPTDLETSKIAATRASMISQGQKSMGAAEELPRILSSV